jgi:FtsZ-binding cell division protein ZapB
MESGFDVLEEKVRRTAELVGRLRKENKALAEKVSDLEQRQATAPPSRELDEARRDAARLMQEREQIRARIARMVAALDALA